MSEHPGGEVVKLTFRALSDTVPASIRIKHLLKTALRQLRLRCVKVEDVPPFPDQPPTTEAPP